MSRKDAYGIGFDEDDFQFEVPEIELDLAQELPPGSPRPILWRVLVLPLVPKKISKGGIHLVDETQRNQGMINYIGRVAAMGSLAYKIGDTADEEKPPEVGDYVIFGRYAGVRIEYKGVKMLILNSVDIQAVTKDPTGYRIYV